MLSWCVTGAVRHRRCGGSAMGEVTEEGDELEVTKVRVQSGECGGVECAHSAEPREVRSVMRLSCGVMWVL